MNNMRSTRIAVAVLALIFLVAAALTLRGFNLLAARDPGDVKPVPPGDQEIAWIDAATSGDVWERLVRALHNLEATWPTIHPTRPPLHVDYDRAFLELTADTPEIALWVGAPGSPRLWLRWYKASSEAPSRSWVEKLARRPTPPLAVIGGDTSDRALRLARILRDFSAKWPGPAPLFLITTATADRYDPKDSPQTDLVTAPNPRLMEVYRDRSFRFAFTNTRIAEAVKDFVESHPDLWTDSDPERLPKAAIIASLSTWQSLAALAAVPTLAGPPIEDFAVFALSWSDDRYSRDLSDQFVNLFKNTGHPTVSDKVGYSVGDFYQPNPGEVYQVDRFLLGRVQEPTRRQLLVLPTGAQPARRFLRTLVRKDPLGARKLVAVTGDSINFNNIFRDRDTVWNVLDIPVPLVLFSHRNPVDESAGFSEQADGDHPFATTGTQDLLLHRDLMEAVIGAAFRDGGLVHDAGEMNQRLRETHWKKGRVFVDEKKTDDAAEGGVSFFNADGDRRPRTGEHIVWLRPLVEGERTLPEADITVWRLRSDDVSSGWQLKGGPFRVSYEHGQ